VTAPRCVFLCIDEDLAFAEARFWECGEYQAPSWFKACVKLYKIPSAGHHIGSGSMYLREIF
jgi:hypothetical protein